MPLGHWNVEFSNLNSQRRYPLADDADSVDTSGSFKLPTSLLLELDLPIHAGLNVDPARFFLKSIGSYATGYFLVVGYQPATGDAVDVATALVPREGHTPLTIYALGGISPFDDTVGKVVVGRLDDADLQPAGQWDFDLDNGRLDPDCVRPIIQGVSALVLVNGASRSVRIQGDVELRAGTNVRLVPILVAGQDPVVRIDAVSGEGTTEECDCEGESAPKEPILTIEGIPPTPSGDFTFVGGDCIRIDPIEHGLRFTDTCAKPCCGCAELERLTNDLKLLGSQADGVEQFVHELSS